MSSKLLLIERAVAAGTPIISAMGAGNKLDPVSYTHLVPAESENENEYVGTALFRDGLMVGELDGLETSLVNAVRGAPIFFGYSLDGFPISLQSHDISGLEIYEDENGTTRIGLSLIHIFAFCHKIVLRMFACCIISQRGATCQMGKFDL